MKFKNFNKVFKSVGLGLVAMAFAFIVYGSSASAVVNNGAPVFNYFNDVSGIGDEHDFLRIQNDDGSRVNSAEVCDGEVNMWLYIHNSQSDLYNGDNYDGVGVAHDTFARVDIPSNEANNHTITGFVGASNAATVSDTAELTCGSDPVTLDYVADSLTYATNLPQGYTVTGDITSAQGATITMNGQPNGTMPACWDYRISLRFKIKVTKKVVPPASIGVCKSISLLAYDDRRAKVTVNGDVDNAQIIGYEINWGDGNTSDKQTDEHVYADDGTYNITARVLVKYADGSTEWKDSTGCTGTVTFESNKPPVVVVNPETPVQQVSVLPDTGAGSIAGIFAALSVAGTLAYRFVWSRRFL